MKITDREILREWVSLFLIAIFIFFFVFLVARLDKFALVAFSRPDQIPNVGLAFLCLAPRFLDVAAPLAVALASIMTYAKMSTDNEITIYQAAALSPLRLIAPTIFAALVVTVGLLIVSVNFSGPARERLKDALLDLGKASASSLIAPSRFSFLSDDILIHVGGERDGVYSSIFIAARDPDSDRPDRALEARSGSIVVDPDSSRTMFEARSGAVHIPGRDQEGYQTIFFERYSFPLDQGRPALAEGGGEKIEYMSARELTGFIANKERLIAQGVDTEYPYEAKSLYHRRYAIPLGALAMALLGSAIGLMVAPRGRSSPGAIALGVGAIAFQYLIAIEGREFGASGEIDPVLAAWAPNFIIVLVAGWLLHRRCAHIEPLPSSIRRLGERLGRYLPLWGKGRGIDSPSAIG